MQSCSVFLSHMSLNLVCHVEEKTEIKSFQEQGVEERI